MSRAIGISTPDKRPAPIALTERWYAHPERPCAGDERYADLKQEPNRVERERMARACLRCPVLYECLDDSLRYPEYQRYGIRAGNIGRA